MYTHFPINFVRSFLLWCWTLKLDKLFGAVSRLCVCPSPKAPSQMEFLLVIAWNQSINRRGQGKSEKSSHMIKTVRGRKERQTGKVSFPLGWGLRAGSQWLAPHSPLVFWAPPVSFCLPMACLKKTTADCWAPHPPLCAVFFSCDTQCPYCGLQVWGLCLWKGVSEAGIHGQSWVVGQEYPESLGHPSLQSCW